MNQWMVRVVDESLVIGGNTKYLYEITPGDTLKNLSLIHISSEEAGKLSPMPVNTCPF